LTQLLKGQGSQSGSQSGRERAHTTVAWTSFQGDHV
jgi:hypothetical protein